MVERSETPRKLGPGPLRLTRGALGNKKAPLTGGLEVSRRLLGVCGQSNALVPGAKAFQLGGPQPPAASLPRIRGQCRDTAPRYSRWRAP